MTTSRKHRLATTTMAAATAAALLALMTGCGSDDSGSNSASTPEATSSTPTPSPDDTATGSLPGKSTKTSDAAEDAVITVKDFAFSGADSVAPGTEITVTNEDTEAHTLTADDGSSFDVTIAPGDSASFTAPDSAGDYAYHCNFHSNMAGSLTVS